MPRIYTLLFVGLLALNASADDDWTSYRGTNGDGVSDATGLPAKFGEGENVRWKTAIHGKAWSSPVILGEQIWLTTATEDGREMSAVCVDRESGRIVHDRVVFRNEKPHFCHPTNSYASPTPVVEPGRLYVHFGRYGTACLDTETGETLWERRDLDCDHYRGPGSSPIVEGDLLFASYDGIDVQYLLAFDKRTGKTVWNEKRSIDYGTDNGDRMKAYSTPSVITVDGKQQLVSPAAVETIAYAPDTGDELWRVRHGGMNAACRPLFKNGLVYLSAGDGPLSFVAVRPNGAGDVTDTHVAWASGQSIPKRSSQIVLGDLLFMTADNGVATCRDAKTGRLHWQQRHPGEYWASPVAADGKVYFFSKEGKIPVVRASSKYELLSMNTLDSGINSSPAIVERAMYLRTFTHLYRIEQE